MEKQLESELPKPKASDNPKPLKAKAENSTPQVEHISSRALPAGLISVSEKLGALLVSNQAYLVNGVPVLWVGAQRKIFYGSPVKEASGATMLQAALAAGLY